MTSPWPLPVVALSPLACGSTLWRMRGVQRVTVIAKATFGLVQGHSARLIAPAEIVREDRWRAAPGSVEEASETAPYLPSAGVTLRGSACAQAGAQVTGAAVRLAIYRDKWILDKKLYVYGDRAAPQASPRPFQRMPITYERAYGGPGVEDNPVGVGAGHDARVQPNIVDPADPLRPAGFGPIPREWPARRRLLDRAQRSALVAAVPELPEGFDWRYFQAAPADQQIDFLRGDEWIFVEGMHPDLPRIQSRLPSARGVAVWFQTTGAGAGPARPIDLVADTLAIDADRQLCTVIWRGSFVVDASHAASPMHVFAGLELPGHAVKWPRPEDLMEAPAAATAARAHGAGGRAPEDEDSNASTNQMRAKEPAPARQQGISDSLPISDALPISDEGTVDDPNAGTARLTIEQLAAGARKPIAPFAIAQPGSAGARPSAAIPGAPWAAAAKGAERPPEDANERTMGINIEELRAQASKAIAPFALAQPGARAPEAAEIPGAPWSRAQAAEAPRPIEGHEETAFFTLPKEGAEAALPFSRSPEGPSTGPVPRIAPAEKPPAAKYAPYAPGKITDDSTITGAPYPKERAPAWLSPAQRGEEEPPPSVQPPMMPPPMMAPPMIQAPVVQTPVVQAPMVQTPMVQAPMVQAPMVQPAQEQPPPRMVAPSAAGAASSASARSREPSPASKGIRADVLARARAGEAMRGLDLAGTDLRELDLRGANFAGTNLKGTILARADLSKARLAAAELVGADLGEADLSRADLAGADLTRATLADARLEGASLTGAIFAAARGTGARFEGATGQRVSFARGAWDGASFAGADLPSADFTGASLAGASFKGASLTEVRIEEATGGGAIFDGARMPQAQAQSASLAGGSFIEVEAPGSMWERATLDQCAFASAKLEGANLSRASCARASFAGADLGKANLQRLSADGATLSRANLEGADLRQARLQEASFEEAVLRNTNAGKADLTQSSFARADLRGAVLRATKLKGANLSRAQLDGADLRDADLERADVRGATRQGAKMNGANVRELVEGEAEGSA